LKPVDPDDPRGPAPGDNQRRAECESALRTLRTVEPGLRALRDVTRDLLTAEQGRLDNVQLRRARHVVTEKQRVLDSAAALRRGAVDQFGRLMAESHASLRDDYEVRGPELDTLVSIALDTEGVLGARLTGAGRQPGATEAQLESGNPETGNRWRRARDRGQAAEPNTAVAAQLRQRPWR